VINNIYENVKNIDLKNVSKNDAAAKFSKAINDGVLSIISNDQGQLSLNAILGKKDLVEALIAKIGYSDYVDFINLLFDTSNVEKKTGIFKMLQDIIDPKESSKGSNLSMDVSIFDISDKTQKLLIELFKPMYDVMFEEIVKENSFYKQKDSFYKDHRGYKALYRTSISLLWIAADSLIKDGKSFFIWNATNTTLEGIVNSAMYHAFYASRGKYLEKLKKLNGTELSKVGANRYVDFVKEFIVGNRSNGTTEWNYWRTQALAYIYYSRSDRKDRHSNNSKKEVLYESLKKGYLWRIQNE
ncbi:hypothetical protein, partial [Mycoplasmopsis alligatoris]